MKGDRHDLPRMFASLRFTGVLLRPSQITEFFGVNPTYAYSLGEEYYDERTRESHFRKIGLWIFSTEGHPELDSMQAHLGLVESVLTKVNDYAWHDISVLRIADFINRNELLMTVSLFWHGAASSLPPAYDERFAENVVAMGGTFERDFDTEDTVAA